MLKKDLKQGIRKDTKDGVCHWLDIFPLLGSVTVQTVLRLKGFFQP